MTIIFGQSSQEKPNAGKPMQQMRVSLLIFSKNLVQNKTNIIEQKSL